MIEEKKINNMNVYTQKEIISSSKDYFNGDVMAAEVWMKKYALKDTNGNIYELTPDDMHRRIAKELARVEQKYINPMAEDEIFDLIKGFKYIVPQGSPMAGIGNTLQAVSLSNCFVIGHDYDSYGSILRVDEEQTHLMKRRGGVGHDLSHIRPKGSVVNNSALTSTGIVPFMERYSQTTREVAQDGRRGALMLSISIEHPDAEDFIDAKMQEGKVTGANVSVKLTNEFMEAALNNKPFIQKYPIGSNNPIFSKEIDANALWKKIVYNAWKSAEPGVLFWDNLINESIPDCYGEHGFKTVSTNPCITSDSWIMTSLGAKQVKDLIGVSFFAMVNNAQYLSKEGFFYTGDKVVYEIETVGGLKIKATDNHKFKKVVSHGRYKKDMEWVELKNLNVGDRLCLNENKNINFSSSELMFHATYDMEIGWLIGSLVGDGSLVGETAYLRYWGTNRSSMKKIAVDYIKSSLPFRDTLGSGCDDNQIITVKSSPLGRIAKECFQLHNNKNIGVQIEKQSSKFYCGFISGLFDADGTVLDNIDKGISVRLSSSNLNNLEAVQRMLLRIGIMSSIAKNRRNEGKRMLPNGKGGLSEYTVKSQHELIISKQNIDVFVERIGFRDELKKEKLNKALYSLKKRGLYKKNFIDKIKLINAVGIEDVYDCCVEDAHEFDCNGISVHNCGEIPLCPADACRLLSINLYSYVEHPFTENAKFNMDLFKQHVIKAQRMMDDIVDLEIEKIDAILRKIDVDPEPESLKQIERDLWERIKHKTQVGRRCGLGITAEGDMLAALGLIYGSDDAIDFAENVHKTLKLEAYRSSVIMGKERGSFSIWDANVEKNNPFLNRIKDEDEVLYNEMMEFGRRNIALLTIAPTGSVSILTQTTSGIEPVFLANYTRRRKINPHEKNVKVDFTDKQGDTWQEYQVFHHKFETWLEVNGYNVNDVKQMSGDEIDKIVKNSPYYKATSADVDWVKKVEMQGRIQKHVDHSISVTVNLPSDATEEIVSKVYETGWRVGCKGLTVYRDGCRSGVLISKKDESQKKTYENNAVKRPKIVSADVFAFQNNYEKWVAIVGKVIPFDGGDEFPYELFTGRLEAFPIPSYVEKGQIIKRKTKNSEGKDMSVYDFRYIDKDGYSVEMSGLSRSFNEEYWNYAKLISAILRHGMPMPYVLSLIESLKLQGDSLNTWKNGVERTLRKYVKDGTESSDVCEVCGAKLVYVEGCLKCNSCGQFSKCS